MMCAKISISTTAMAMSMSHSGMMCCVNSFAAKLALTAGRDLK